MGVLISAIQKNGEIFLEFLVKSQGLKFEMAEQAKDEISTETLSQLFQRGLDLHESLENSESPINSPEFQNKVRQGILILEDCTRMVSLLDLFSRNETVSEVTTEHLKYFLLPVLLGNFNAKLAEQDRLEIITIVETYFKDFLQRIKDYEIANVPNIQQNISTTKAKSSDVSKMNREREEKIRRYKESKELEGSIKLMKVKLGEDHCDEELLRDYYLKLIRKSVHSAMDELSSFEIEKEILEHMAKMRESGSAAATATNRTSNTKRRPLKPIVITRDALQKEVFGMGYKHLPILTIEEFYEQRVRDGWFPSPEETKKQNSLLNRAMTDSESARNQEDEEAR